jgi:hypothetical protein
MNIVFLNVGPDVATAALMVRSIRAHNPGARIIQATDALSPAVPGVDDVQRVAGDSRRIMTFRVLCFAKMDVSTPTWFLDTDMLCLAPLPVIGEGGPVTGVCMREFDRHVIFNHAYGGLDFSRYEGMNFGTIYPFLACANFVSNGDFWQRCLDHFSKMPAQFHYWYGDQEAIKHVVAEHGEGFIKLPESVYACLPEYENPQVASKLMHYKGGKRKPLMIARARKEGIAA